MASLFLDFPCLTAQEERVLLVEWCSVDVLVAIATDNNQLNFYEDEGAQLQNCNVTRPGCQVTCMAWGTGSGGRVLAAGWSDGHVGVYAITPSSAANAAGGSNNGDGGSASSSDVLSTNNSDSPSSGGKLDCVCSNDTAHSTSNGGVRFLLWNPAGSRLVTGDGSGMVRVWKADGRGMLSAFKQYSTGSRGGMSGCTTAVFSGARKPPSGHDSGPSSSKEKELASASASLARFGLSGYGNLLFGSGLGSGSAFASSFSPPFFFGSEDGRVFFADDLGHSAEVQSLGSVVDTLLFYEDRSRLVILTRALLLTQLQVSDDGRVSPVQKVKLSIAGGNSPSGASPVRQVAWAGPGLLACASGESLVRFWNLATDENYTLPLAKPIARSDKVLSVAFNPAQRYLAAGTREGKVAFFRFVGLDPQANGGGGGGSASSSSSTGEQDASGPGDWEAMTPTAVGWKAPVECLGWMVGRGTLACGGANGCSVMREDVLHRVTSASGSSGGGPVAALQLTSQLLRVDRRLAGNANDDDGDSLALSTNSSGGGGCYVLRAAMNVRGLAVSSHHLCAWNGSQAQVFRLDDTNAEPLSVHATTARAMVFQGEYLLRCQGSEVQQCNLAGRVVSKMPFSEAEGSPCLVDRNGSFLAVATTLGVIKVFDLSRKDKTQAAAAAAAAASSSGGSATAAGGGAMSSGGHAGWRQVGSTGRFADVATGTLLGTCRSIAVNCTGTRVSILGDRVVSGSGASVVLEPDSRLHVYDTDRDVIESFECGKNTNLLSSGGGSESGKNDALEAERPPGCGLRYPVAHFWDCDEPRLVAIETRRVRTAASVRQEQAEVAKAAAAGNGSGGTNEVVDAIAEGKESEGKDSYGDSSGGESKSYGSGSLSPVRPLNNAHEAESQLRMLQGNGTSAGGGSGGLGAAFARTADGEVSTLFATADQGLLLQGTFPIELPLEGLVGLRVPHLLFASKRGGGDQSAAGSNDTKSAAGGAAGASAGGGSGGGGPFSAGPFIATKVLHDFVGLDTVDVHTRKALLDFAYYLTVQNMDEAHRAVKLIKNPSVWENMALMCVKTRRLDVAEVCLGQMGFARGAAAVRLARAEAPDEPDVALAAVAIQLGLLSDAEKLYAGRPDLLNKLYQAAGCWDRALELASSSDRIHLKTTHHAFAKHLEDQGNVAAAIDHFEMADTHRVEVPRLLFERKQLGELEDYVLRSKPKVSHRHKSGGGGLANSFGEGGSKSSNSSGALLSPNPSAKFNEGHLNHPNASFSPQSPSAMMSDTGSLVQGPDPALATWWAGYLEATGQFDRAADFYARAHDAFALVRIACFNRDLNAAKKLVDEDPSGGGAAAYYLARYLEGVGEVADAINYYASAKCFNHAVRLAKAVGLDADLMAYALQGGAPSLMADVATYFEDRGELEKAVQLYQRAGDLSRALDLCFRAAAAQAAERALKGNQGRGPAPASGGMFDALQAIASSLDASANPAIVARCAAFFIEHGQFDQAVALCIKGERHLAAIDLCAAHKVFITDEMAEKLTPAKPPTNAGSEDSEGGDDYGEGKEGEGKGGESKGGYGGGGGSAASRRKAAAAAAAEDRNETLRALARALKKQGSYTLACKKFTQAGEREKAMKCLLKAGDTKALCYYATLSRNRNIYILAANYLQALDWQADPEIMKNIVDFYTKAKAFEQLASFFDAYAQMEIDEYRDYEKALAALKKAAEYLGKARGPQKDDMLASLQQRVTYIQQFVEARATAKSDPATMQRLCHALLDAGPSVEAALRVGDAYALLIESYVGSQNFQAAYELLQGMRSRRIVLNPYLEQDVINDIHRHVGAGPPPEGRNGHNISPSGGGRSAGGGGADRGGGAGGDEDEEEEELGEELDEPVEEMDTDGEFGGK